MRHALIALLEAPAHARPAGPSIVDRVLVAVLLPLAVVEGSVRDGLTLRPLQIAISCAVIATLLLRRAHPLRAMTLAFGLVIGLGVTELATGLRLVELFSSAAILLLPYSLLRWGSGREIALGLALELVAYGISALQGDLARPEDAIGSAVVLLFPAALGASARFRAQALRRDLDHAKLRERELLARELHDTVAHHVSAIVVQAQAARAVLATRPEAARAALVAIEGEAQRSLAELRDLVSTLRDDRPASRQPLAGLAELERLAASDGPMRIELERDGPLDDLPPALEAALYRLAQESITNARRHARHATRVRVRIEADAARVRLTVRDDGELSAEARRGGFGLVGMAERAALLGGTFEAGPAIDGGWEVEAVLPRRGGVE